MAVGLERLGEFSMARFRGSITKQSRRERFSLHPKADKALVKRNYAPGMHGRRFGSKPSNFSIQLREKQKVKRLYGVLEKQFRRYVKKAINSDGISGDNLLILLEIRLDNLCYRAGLASSRQGARQLVNHGHIVVNGKKVNIPSYQVKVGDKVTIKSESVDKQYFKLLREGKKEKQDNSHSWLKIKPKDLAIEVISWPMRDELDKDINEQLIIEYYSR